MDKCDKVLSEEEKNLLTGDIQESEIWDAIKCMSNNKSPGSDGLPIEFYKKVWKIIKFDYMEMVKYVCNDSRLSNSQLLGIIKLIAKSGDLKVIENWRPISLLNVDYKIFAKVLTNRLKSLVHKFFSKEQYCGVIGKSIVNCNNTIRDIFYCINENDKELAVMNLDWAKAFDRVNVKFVFQVMDKFGFPKEFIDMIKILYKECKSCVYVNGALSSSFFIKRSIRQGCPLSMLLYVIFQEPVYIAIKTNKMIIGPSLPNKMKITIQGFADDSSVLLSSDRSICECYEEIQRFELATGSKLNKDKTTIMGIGKWKNRKNWPLDWIKSVDCTKILGIYFHNDYVNTLEENWRVVTKKIETSVNVLSQRKLSLFQKAIVINSLILSKVWYIAHTLPPVKQYIMKINASIFRYMWCGSYHPINRNTLCLPRESGGVGIINIHFKALSIFSSTCLKELFNEEGLCYYYCSIRLSYLVDDRHYKELSFLATPYYGFAIDIIRKICKHKKFPSIKSKEIYSIIKPNVKASVEENYPLFKWNVIWENINKPFIGILERELIYRYIHGTLATNQRLKILSIRENGKCDYCEEIEYISHIFYFCKFIRESLLYFQNVLFHCCHINKDKLMHTLMFNFEYKSNKDRNSSIIMITGYIYAVWVSKKKKYTKEQTCTFIKSKLCYDRWLLRNLYKNQMTKIFTKNYIECVF